MSSAGYDVQDDPAMATQDALVKEALEVVATPD